MEKIFEIVTRYLSEFFKTNSFALFQWDEPKNELILRYTSGLHQKTLENLRRIRADKGIFQRMIREKNSQIENEIFREEKELASSVKLDGLESMISAPVFSKRNIWGALAVFSQEKYKFKKPDGELLNLWIAQIGELQNFFSSYLKTRVDESLVQILGNVELSKFRLRNKKIIQAEDVLDVLDHLKNIILSTSPDFNHLPTEPTSEKRIEEKPIKDIYTEELITIEGETIPRCEKRKVLIIDDQPIITDLLVDILKRMGYNSEVAFGGKDGIKIFAKNGFDLVITDVGMPDISGWEVSKSVKRQNPSVPVILITAWEVEPDPYKVRDSGVDFIINKPFQIDQLEKIITNLVNKKERMD